MSESPLKKLLQSRKFLVAILDAVVATLTMVATIVLSPEHVQTMLIVIGIWQPVLVVLIYAIAKEDAAEAEAEAMVRVAQLAAEASVAKK